ncbi:MAG: 4-hydroxy-3-methylbut-2-enyl diphosphate reductase [Victivallales bacterium]|nr:4-hydroxy-3-methylbut-2-enyl diphosphate reductase [Victivallales bacterium]
MQIASSLGFCGGVRRAMQSFEQLRSETPPDKSVYVLHELVHNRTVTEQMAAHGAIFIQKPEELPIGATCLIGAHGVGREAERLLRNRAGRLVDATCPIVKNIQQAAAGLAENEELVLAGLRGHPEVEGILGHAGTSQQFLVSCVEEVACLPELSNPVMLCQTTMHHEVADTIFTALQKRFPSARRGGVICHASSERQAAVEALVSRIDLLLVIGSPHSSNANRLREIGERAGIPSYLVDGPEQLPADLAKFPRVGVAAGASTPDEQIQRVIAAVRKLEAFS